jgi:cyanophycinase
MTDEITGMNGQIALLGSGEYLPVMEPIDRYLLESLHLNGRKPRVVCLPTAAGMEGDASVDRWIAMGLGHFQRLGVDVKGVRITDRDEAGHPRWADLIAEADLVYFSGGNPLYLYQTLAGTQAWAAAEQAWSRGAAFAGCSAGAMILARFVPDIRSLGMKQIPAFGVVPAESVIPHFDRMKLWRPMILTTARKRLSGDRFVLGIDEETALVGRLGGEWRVMGRGRVYIIKKREEFAFSDGQTVPLV